MNLKLNIERHIGILLFIVLILIISYLSKTVNELGVDYIENERERVNGILIGAEPIFMQNSDDIGVLMLHGYTSSPGDFKDFADYLTERNITVYAPLLPGHGTHPRDLKEITAEDWKKSAQESLKKLNTKKKFVMGYSMGGALALDLASKEDFNGIILINSAIFLENRYIPFISIINIVETYTSIKNDDIISVINKERTGYTAHPIKTILEVKNLIDSISLYKISEPVLILQSDNDETVSPQSALFIFNTVQSEEKEMILLNNSTHSRLNNKEEIFKDIYNFIKEN